MVLTRFALLLWYPSASQPSAECLGRVEEKESGEERIVGAWHPIVNVNYQSHVQRIFVVRNERLGRSGLAPGVAMLT